MLRADATVTGDVVRIGDLVDHAGMVANIPIFRAPDLGTTGMVSAEAVVEAVRPHALIGLDTGGLSEVMVTRLSRRIMPKEIQSAIAQAIARQYALGPAENISLNLDRELRAFDVPPNTKGEPRIEGLSFDPRDGRFDVAVDLPAGAPGRGHLRITGHAAVTVETVTPAHTIARGELIRDDDLVVQRHLRSEITGTTVTDIKQAVGYAARVTLQPDRPIHAGDLMKPVVVQRNEQVTLIYQVPGIVLTIRGKATEAGAEGDSIMVLNEQTKRTVQGIVDGPGRVIVGGAKPQLAANTQSPTEPCTPDSHATANQRNLRQSESNDDECSQSRASRGARRAVGLAAQRLRRVGKHQEHRPAAAADGGRQSDDATRLQAGADADAADPGRLLQSQFAVAQRLARLLQGPARASGGRHPYCAGQHHRQGEPV